MRTFASFALAVPLLALAACEEEAPQPSSAETGGEAAGEVLGGTISDGMIPLEELTSTSPPAERSATANETAGQSAPEATAAPSAPPEAPQPNGPVTAGPAQPEPETTEAAPPAGGPAS